MNELSTVSANVAIPTIWLRGAARCWGNCMRHSWDSSPGGSHALPLIAPPVAQPVAQAVAQPVARQRRASGLARWIPPTQTTCPSPTVTDHWAATHGPAMLYSQERGKRDQLKWRFYRATKPKSRLASNTFCPSSTLAPIAFHSDFHAPASRTHATQPTRCVDHPRRGPPPSTPTGVVRKLLTVCLCGFRPGRTAAGPYNWLP